MRSHFPAKPARVRVDRFSLLLIVGLTLLTPAARGENPSPPPTGPILTLAGGGGSIPGVLAEASRPEAVGWRAASFATPFDFPLDEVESIRFPSSEKSAVARGTFGFELSNGDRLYGSIVTLDDQVAELETAQLGRLRVARTRIKRLFRWGDGADLIYNGPTGLTGWREFTPPKPGAKPAAGAVQAFVFAVNQAVQPPGEPSPPPAAPAPGWLEDGGELHSTKEGVTIQANVELPRQATIELELSWKQTPNFMLALGVSNDEKSVARAFRFEVWEGQLVAFRETDKEADLAPIQPIASGTGRTHLQLLLDQEVGKLLVFSEHGEPLAELKLGGAAGPGSTGVRLTNIQGDLRLERLRVGRWDGATTQPAMAADALAQLRDRSVVRGQLDRFDPATREFLVRGEAGIVRIAEDQIANIALPGLDEDLHPTVRVSYSDGTQLGGDWVGMRAGRLAMTVPGVVGLVQFPQEGVRSLEVLQRNRKPRDETGLIGTLDVGGFRTKGRLVNSEGRPGESPLAWQPLASDTASPLAPGASGRIVYQTPAPPPTPPVQTPGRVMRRGVAQLPAQATTSAKSATTRRSLYLRSGDIVPVEVTKIDEDGVWFQSPFSQTHFVPNAKVKAVELAADDPTALRLTRAKFERLMTLPRMQRESPPTHLIRSKNGDMLRGRIAGMDDKMLRVEVRLEAKEILRDRVSKIIWLHPDEIDPSKKAVPPPEVAGTTRVQAVRTDGNRLTFVATGFAEGTLRGKSDILGACQVRLQDIDQLVIGASIEKEATQLAYQSYKLQNAIEPKSAQDGDDSPGGGAAGTESLLVGKPAPDFQLELLDGSKFHLADQKGKVIVLDFWATWCGPCLQAMPQIERATTEFADKGVQLIAVNLQETPAQIKAMLERQKLSPQVALDRTGSVAEKYGASAIPQTVVIDREGKITRLFIGGGPKLGEQLKEALQALMPAG